MHEVAGLWAVGEGATGVGFVQGKVVRDGEVSRYFGLDSLFPSRSGGNKRLELARTFATAVLRDVLGVSPVVQPYASNALVPLLNRIVGQKGPDVVIPLTEVAGLIRSANPGLPALLSDALDIAYVGYEQGRGNAVKAYVGTRSTEITGEAPISWGFSGQGPREFSERILEHFEHHVQGLKPGAHFNGERALTFRDERILSLPQLAHEVVIFGAEVAAFVLERYPALLLGSPQTDLRTDGERSRDMFRGLETTTLGAVRRAAEAGGSRQYHLGERWATVADMVRYSVLAVADPARGITVYAADRGLRSGGPQARGGDDLPASAPVLVLGRIPLSPVASEDRGLVADIKWLVDTASNNALDDLDALIAAVDERSIPSRARRAEWDSRSPYPYRTRLDEFESTHLTVAENAFAESLGNDWRDAGNRRFELKWSSADGYLYGVQLDDDGTHLPAGSRPPVEVLGRFATDLELDWALGDTAQVTGRRGGLDELASRVGAHLLDSQSPAYAFGTRGPLVVARQATQSATLS